VKAVLRLIILNSEFRLLLSVFLLASAFHGFSFSILSVCL
jgi:hypothetical protein